MGRAELVPGVPYDRRGRVEAVPPLHIVRRTRRPDSGRTSKCPRPTARGPRLTRRLAARLPLLVMRTARLRYSGLALLLLVVAGVLVAAWLLLNHLVFSIVAVTIAWRALMGCSWPSGTGWRQSSAASLTSRGIYPESDRALKILDPGLRREWGG